MSRKAHLASVKCKKAHWLPWLQSGPPIWWRGDSLPLPQEPYPRSRRYSANPDSMGLLNIGVASVSAAVRLRMCPVFNANCAAFCFIHALIITNPITVTGRLHSFLQVATLSSGIVSIPCLSTSSRLSSCSTVLATAYDVCVTGK